MSHSMCTVLQFHCSGNQMFRAHEKKLIRGNFAVQYVQLHFLIIYR